MQTSRGDCPRMRRGNCLQRSDMIKKRVYFYIPVLLWVCSSFVTMLFMLSCGTFQDIIIKDVLDSIADPKTGTPILTREYDTEPYQINVGGIIKSRKALKKKRSKEIIENYDKIKPIGAKDK